MMHMSRDGKIGMPLRRFHRHLCPRSGYVLMAIMFFMTLWIVSLLATAPAIKAQIQRDREEEMIHRGAQYSRAIKKYFKKFGRYPTSLDQLKETNNVRFLRKEYKDPMSTDGKWRLLHIGDVKIGSASNVGTPVPAMSTMGGSASNMGQSGQSTLGGVPGMSAPGNSASSMISSTTAIGGGTIIGVASVSEKQGLHEFNEKTHYNEWYFVYDPTTDRGGLINGPYTGKTFGTVSGVGTPVGTHSQPQSGTLGPPSSFGQPASFGQPSSPSQPSTPQQQ
jgi:type II secretory pathway pseudopilin PulG